MVRLGRILASVALISVVVLSSCLGGDIDSNVTTYTTIEEQSSHVGSEGGQIQLDDGSNVAIPQDTLDEVVMLTLSRKSGQGELLSSIDEDPDSRLISDFYFLQVDEVLNQERGVALEFPFESSSPSNQVRVIEVFNIEDETYTRLVDATVDETSRKVKISDIGFFPTESAIQEYETEFLPMEDFGFHGMSSSIGYAAISDTDHSNSTLLESFVQTQSEESTSGCSIRWGRIQCIGERADVLVSYLLGTGDDMVEYAHSALQYAESIQRAYSDAGFQTRDKIVVHISSLIPSSADTNGFHLPGLNRMWIKSGLDTSRGGDLNVVVNHETVHTMQSVLSPPWWKESSADWIAYYFETDGEGRQGIRNNTVLLILSSENPFQEPFPPGGFPVLGADQLYDYSVLIDYAVEAGHLSSANIVGFINEDYDPTGQFEDIYRYQADGFAQYLAEIGFLGKLARMTSAEGEVDGHSSGSIVLSIDVTPLTLPLKRYAVKPGTGYVTFQVSLQEVTNDGGIVVGSHSKSYEGFVHKYNTSLSTSKTLDIYLLPFAKGNLNAQLELLVEWEPWSPDEFTLTTTSTAGGSVTTPGEGTYDYSEGTVVNLVAEAEEGYSFVNWTGDVGTIADVNAAITTVTMNDDYSIIASFDLEQELPIYFPDPNLEAAIREAIGKPTGDIWPSDLESLTGFEAVEWGIADLTGLEYCTSLAWLNLRSNEISDISPLANLTNLTHLNLGFNQIGDISPLANLTNLTYLHLWSNQLGDISPLASLTNLILLQLVDNQISDISPLANLTNLTILDIAYNEISDISPLANLANLIHLYPGHNEISDISPLANLTNLTFLNLSGAEISDVSALANLTGLTVLHLENNNQIGDISPLANLTNLTNLYLEYNEISDISPLANLTDLTSLNIGFNQISNVSPLVDNPGLGEGDVVDLYANPLSDDSINIYIPELEARGVIVHY